MLPKPAWTHPPRVFETLLEQPAIALEHRRGTTTFDATFEDVLIPDPIEFVLDVRLDALPDHGSRFVVRVPGPGDLGHSVSMGRIPGGTRGDM